MDDQVRHGTRTRGERCNLAKITEEKAIQIKEALKVDSGYGAIKRVAEKTGAPYRVVADIKNGNTWRHV
jgi:hypothetical protein